MLHLHSFRLTEDLSQMTLGACSLIDLFYILAEELKYPFSISLSCTNYHKALVYLDYAIYSINVSSYIKSLLAQSGFDQINIFFINSFLIIYFLSTNKKK